jgi:hypothetical protein
VENNVWSAGVSLPTGRGKLGVAVVDDLIYVVGGTGRSVYEAAVNTNERYIPVGFTGKLPTLNPSVTASPIENKSISTLPLPTENSPSQSASEYLGNRRLDETPIIIAGVALVVTFIFAVGLTAYHSKHRRVLSVRS